jgi:hypothetical protein
MAKKTKPAAKFTLPEGTIIYHSLFTKDQFDEGSKAAYKIEMAFPKGSLQEFGLEDMIIEAGVSCRKTRSTIWSGRSTTATS